MAGRLFGSLTLLRWHITTSVSLLPQNDLLSSKTTFHDFLSPDFPSKTVMQPNKQEETMEILFQGHKVGLDPCVHTDVLEIAG